MKSQHARWFVRLVAAALIAAGTWSTAAPASAAVTVSTFTATGSAQEILLEWTTASELDNLGFNILRSTAANGNYTAINDDLIFSECLGCIGGASYSYADTSVVAGQTYFYQLESVSFNDVTELFGPVSASAGPAPTPTPTPTPTATASPTQTPQAESATSTHTPTPTATGDLPASPTASATAAPATAPTPTSLALLAPLPTASLAPTPIVAVPAGPSPSPRPTRVASLRFGPMAVTPQANAAGFDSADATTESRDRARLLVLAAAFGLGLLIEWALIVGLYGVWRFRAGA